MSQVPGGFFTTAHGTDRHRLNALTSEAPDALNAFADDPSCTAARRQHHGRLARRNHSEVSAAVSGLRAAPCCLSRPGDVGDRRRDGTARELVNDLRPVGSAGLVEGTDLTGSGARVL